MKIHIIKFIFLLASFSFILSCSEDDKKFEANPDLLMAARAVGYTIELESTNAAKKEELAKKIEILLSEETKSYFEFDYYYEMKLDSEKTLDIYKSKKDFEKAHVYKSGTYQFRDDAMIVSFLVEGKKRTFSVVGSFASTFYNHFMRKEGGVHHDIVNDFGFCLHEDYTSIIVEKYKEDYPEVEIKLVEIKTDMITKRPLETFKKSNTR